MPGCFLVTHAAGFVWTGREWSYEWDKAKLYRPPLAPTGEARTLVRTFRAQGLPVDVSFLVARPAPSARQRKTLAPATQAREV